MICRKEISWIVMSVIVALSLLAGGCAPPPRAAHAWPGSVAAPAARAKEEVVLKRKTIAYDHTCAAEWDTPGKPQSFYVMLPAAPSDKSRPMIVYLHSAGGNAASEMAYAARLAVAAGPEFYALFPNSNVATEDGWWGRNAIQQDPAKYANQDTPVERRTLATIEWVVRKYNIDRNRIYLCGISMGGSGSLGLGLCHGDIFASIFVDVPASANHAMTRMHFPPPPGAQASKDDLQRYLVAVSGKGLPDAPPLVNFSSQVDGWSADQPALLRAMHDGRHAVVFAWGTWGHTIEGWYLATPAACEFPWTSIMRNQAYPVFTDASSDDSYPGLKLPKADPSGQINACFRWAVAKDTRAEFEMDLRLVTQKELSKPVASLPTRSTADVTLRRLQQFKIKPDASYEWRFGTQSGVAKPDAAGLLTLPKLAITNQTTRLNVKLKRFW